MCGTSAIVVLPGGCSCDSCGNDRCDNDTSVQLLQRAKARSTQLTEETEASLKNIQHRGPDYSGVGINADCLWHARLAIRELCLNGNQPLHGPDVSIHAIMNGELYDYEDMKAKLGQKMGCHSHHT
ncbi:uncharacterized protein RAG0_03292 [Rhynchosporium agropyri]|uniref:Glutamine amidotransferase type-2 domain-containing protein n=1 Tax=Rhynchosporium agropyri TaxID=914238 RepID=A0A1E1K3Z5_9HELO|nr:uncharacterized protein RAG0_03292 [Rhynchosporium agropyri]